MLNNKYRYLGVILVISWFSIWAVILLFNLLPTPMAIFLSPLIFALWVMVVDDILERDKADAKD